MKFLIIDDDIDYCEALREYFAGMYPNVAVRQCISVEDALAAIGEMQPDVLFLDGDLTFRGAEGLEVARQISPHIKVYTTTGNGMVQAIFKSQFGIDHVSKSDLVGFGRIIESAGLTEE